MKLGPHAEDAGPNYHSELGTFPNFGEHEHGQLTLSDANLIDFG